MTRRESLETSPTNLRAPGEYPVSLEVDKRIRYSSLSQEIQEDLGERVSSDLDMLCEKSLKDAKRRCFIDFLA